jgi:hypothetical protein
MTAFGRPLNPLPISRAGHGGKFLATASWIAWRNLRPPKIRTWPAAAARLEQARAQLGIARADFYPQLSAGAQMTRQRTSANAPLRNGTATEFVHLQ